MTISHFVYIFFWCTASQLRSCPGSYCTCKLDSGCLKFFEICDMKPSPDKLTKWQHLRNFKLECRKMKYHCETKRRRYLKSYRDSPYLRRTMSQSVREGISVFMLRSWGHQLQKNVTLKQFHLVQYWSSM